MRPCGLVGGREPLTALVVAAELQYGTDTAAEMESLLGALRADKEAAAAILEELAGHPTFAVRSWVPRGARLVLGREGAEIIKSLIRDQDPDVRDAAIEELVELDPREASFLTPSLRKRLASKDLYEPVTAMWMLVRIGDRDSTDLIRKISRNGAYDWHRRSAAVAVMVLEDRDAEIAERIGRHDHDSMPWLSEAAQLLGTPATLAALEESAKAAPDLECRNYCRAALERSHQRTT
jgi:hypothetical protein